MNILFGFVFRICRCTVYVLLWSIFFCCLFMFFPCDMLYRISFVCLCRTDSALKFGWFFLCYAVCILNLTSSYVFYFGFISYILILSFVFFKSVPHWLLHCCCCCASTFFQGEISDVSFSSYLVWITFLSSLYFIIKHINWLMGESD